MLNVQCTTAREKTVRDVCRVVTTGGRADRVLLLANHVSEQRRQVAKQAGACKMCGSKRTGMLAKGHTPGGRADGGLRITQSFLRAERPGGQASGCSSNVRGRASQIGAGIKRARCWTVARSWLLLVSWCTSSSPFALPCSFGLSSLVGRANAVWCRFLIRSASEVPLSVFVETYGTDRITDVLKIELGSRAGAIVVSLVLRKPRYQETAAYCLCRREAFIRNGGFLFFVASLYWLSTRAPHGAHFDADFCISHRSGYLFTGVEGLRGLVGSICLSSPASEIPSRTFLAFVSQYFLLGISLRLLGMVRLVSLSCSSGAARQSMRGGLRCLWQSH